MFLSSADIQRIPMTKTSSTTTTKKQRVTFHYSEYKFVQIDAIARSVFTFKVELYFRCMQRQANIP